MPPPDLYIKRQTLPSLKALIIDVPRGAVQNFSNEFVYNFYVPDEYLNERPQEALQSLNNRIYNLINSPNQNVTLINVLKERRNETYVPRYVNLRWNAIPDIGNSGDLIGTISIADNINIILNEEDIAGQNFTAVKLIDNGSDGQIRYSIARALEEILRNQGINVNNLQASPLDLVRLLNQYTSNQIEGNFLAEMFINYEALGVEFLNQPKYDETLQNVADKLKSIGLRTNINNKFIYDILISATQQADNIFSDETLSILPDVSETQSFARTTRPDVTSISVGDYIVPLADKYISWDPDNEISEIEYQIVGYIIDKTEYPGNALPVVKEKLIVENPNIGNFTDVQVKYGTRYGYTIRSIFVVKIPAINNTGDTGTVTFLISSQPSPEIFLNTVEKRPPNPPTDFNVIWDYENNCPFLSWNMPVDSQRDTKYFQIFKRSSIFEAFQLVKMYDFNDSLTPLSLNTMSESLIDSILVENLRRIDGNAIPKTYYHDKSFEIGQTAIYSICSVDAHGLSSNYSLQYSISFNRNKNKIEKRLISISGAPKPYPNFYLKQDLFVDSVKVSGAKKMEIIFNPEVLRVYDGATDVDFNFIKTELESSYKLQMINLDLQKDNVVTIKINKVEETAPETGSVPLPPNQISTL